MKNGDVVEELYFEIPESHPKYKDFRAYADAFARISDKIKDYGNSLFGETTGFTWRSCHQYYFELVGLRLKEDLSKEKLRELGFHLNEEGAAIPLQTTKAGKKHVRDFQKFRIDAPVILFEALKVKTPVFHAGFRLESHIDIGIDDKLYLLIRLPKKSDGSVPDREAIDTSGLNSVTHEFWNSKVGEQQEAA